MRPAWQKHGKSTYSAPALTAPPTLSLLARRWYASPMASMGTTKSPSDAYDASALSFLTRLHSQSHKGLQFTVPAGTVPCRVRHWLVYTPPTCWLVPPAGGRLQSHAPWSAAAQPSPLPGVPAASAFGTTAPSPARKATMFTFSPLSAASTQPTTTFPRSSTSPLASGVAARKPDRPPWPRC